MTRSARNVLLLMTDQHRLDTLGCYGNTVCRTPALDELASGGTRFDHGFTPTAICTPSRATLVTGVLPYRHKLLANPEHNIGHDDELDGRFPPFSEYLTAAGYRLGHIGKWHVGKDRGPADYGFDGVRYPGWENPVTAADYQAYLSERGLPPYRLRDETRVTFPNGQAGPVIAGVLDQPVEATFDYYLAERTIERLRSYAESPDQPFYLGCHWFGPHLPYCVPEAYYHRYSPSDVELPASTVETFADKPMVQRHYSDFWAFDTFSSDQSRELIAAYWGYVSLIDEQVGRILATLDELGLTESTAVFFTADHGEFTGAHRLHSKGPAMYDDIYRIPLLARVPGLPGGRSCDRFVELTDLTPTFLDLAGVEAPEHFDGRSLLPLLSGTADPQDWPDEFVGEFHGLHFPYPQRMLRTRRYKLVVNPPDRNELYDLAADPHELHNRYDHPELAPVRQRLTERLYVLLRERDDDFRHWMTAKFGLSKDL